MFVFTRNNIENYNDCNTFANHLSKLIYIFHLFKDFFIETPEDGQFLNETSIIQTNNKGLHLTEITLVSVDYMYTTGWLISN
jgi:hypothetical protein